MATRRLIRWSSMSLLLSAVSWVIATLLHPNNFAPNAVLDRRWVPAHIAEGLASLLFVLGLVGLHLRQAEKAGRLGLLGFIMALLGAAATVNVAVMLEAYLYPFLFAQQAAPKSAFEVIDPAGPLAGALIVSMVSSVVYGLGLVLTGIATMRARVLPRWPGLLLIVGIGLSGVGLSVPALWFLLNVGGAVSGIGVAWLGYVLWSEKGEAKVAM